MNNSRSFQGQVKCHVLVVSNNDVMRESVIFVLQALNKFIVDGQAHDGWEAVEMCRRHDPDLIIMESDLPLLSGIQAAYLISTEVPKTRIILLVTDDRITSANDEPPYVIARISKQSPSHALMNVLKTLTE